MMNKILSGVFIAVGLILISIAGYISGFGWIEGLLVLLVTAGVILFYCGVSKLIWGYITKEE